MEVVVNGKLKTLEGPTNLRQLVELLELKADRCAIELNRQIVRRTEWESTLLSPKDELEIVQFVGGG